MYFEMYQEGTLNALATLLGGARDWRWRLKGGNHEIIASGEGYTTKQNCQHAINLVKSTTANTPVHEL